MHLDKAYLTFSFTKRTFFNPLPHMAMLGSCNSAANKDTMSEICTNEDTIIRLSRKHCGKRGKCSLRAISSFPKMFSNAIYC